MLLLLSPSGMHIFHFLSVELHILNFRMTRYYDDDIMQKKIDLHSCSLVNPVLYISINREVRGEVKRLFGFKHTLGTNALSSSS